MTLQTNFLFVLGEITQRALTRGEYPIIILPDSMQCILNHYQGSQEGYSGDRQINLRSVCDERAQWKCIVEGSWERDLHLMWWEWPTQPDANSTYAAYVGTWWQNPLQTVRFYHACCGSHTYTDLFASHIVWLLFVTLTYGPSSKPWTSPRRRYCIGAPQ